MAVIELRKGLTMDTIPQAEIFMLLRQDVLIERLAQLRRDWEQAANGKPLEEVRASVGLMLADFSRMIGLEETK
jgi:hypothetical protein